MKTMDNNGIFPDVEILRVLNQLEEYGQREKEPEPVLLPKEDGEVE